MQTTFGQLKDGDNFESASGSFKKINAYCARRTERHWADSPKVWHFTDTQIVYI